MHLIVLKLFQVGLLRLNIYPNSMNAHLKHYCYTKNEKNASTVKFTR